LDLPYGEWVIFFLALATWTEKRASQRFFLILLIAWLIGKCLEVLFPAPMPWHWHYARLSVMLVFWGWAWGHAEQRILPLLITSFALSLETLFLVNEPGVIPHEAWIFAVVLFFVARLTANSYWGTAATFTGSILLNQVFRRFTYEGLVRSADFPDPFIWNFGVGLFTVWAGLRLGWFYYSARERELQIVEPLSSASELVQLKLNIETSVTKASSGGFRQSRISHEEHLAAKAESTSFAPSVTIGNGARRYYPLESIVTEAEYEVLLPLVEVGVSRLNGVKAYEPSEEQELL